MFIPSVLAKTASIVSEVRASKCSKKAASLSNGTRQVVHGFNPRPPRVALAVHLSNITICKYFTNGKRTYSSSTSLEKMSITGPSRRMASSPHSAAHPARDGITNGSTTSPIAACQTAALWFAHLVVLDSEDSSLTYNPNLVRSDIKGGVIWDHTPPEARPQFFPLLFPPHSEYSLEDSDIVRR